MKILRSWEPGDGFRYMVVYERLTPEQSRATGHEGRPACFFSFGLWEGRQCANTFPCTPGAEFSFYAFTERIANVHQTPWLLSAAYYALMELTGMVSPRLGGAYVERAEIFVRDDAAAQLTGTGEAGSPE